jgi:hypothetical protein
LRKALLSPRLLYFEATNVLWKCQSKSRGLVVPAYSGRLCGTRACMATIISATSQNETYNSSSNLSKHWVTIVEDYSHRVVTIPEDRLPALVGVATEFRSLLTS